MAHGYTQSGSLFHAKTRALCKHLQKSFPLHTLSFSYPTGPLRLNPADIPGYTPPENSAEDASEIEAFGWWRRSNTADPPEYLGLEDGLSAIAKVLKEEGPFDGIIGFSQGAALAAMVGSLLEGSHRRDAFTHFSKQEENGASGIPFSQSFSELNHPPLKFAICYSGFRSPGPRYRAFYENPAIQTPVLHVLGSMDALVDEGRSRALVEACEGDQEKLGRVVWHPGGHFLPSQRAYLDAAVVFIRGCLEGATGGGKEEEKVEDMDVPF